MTQEEKAKKYDEALERAKRWADGTLSPEKTTPKEVCELIFPELRESEDERIRKEIIDFIQWAEDRGMTRHDYHQAKRPAIWIAYLKKQKECVADSSKTSADKDESIGKFLVDYFTSYKIDNVTTKLNGYKIDDILAYLEKQKDLDKMIVVSPEVWDNAISDAFENGEKEGKKQKELPFVKDVVPGLPGLYFYDGERMHFRGNPATKENPYDFAMSQQEKQKEQKPISLYRHYNPDDYEVVIEGNATSLKKKEQKPDIEICPHSIKSKSYKEKPAEWSEEDEKMYARVVRRYTDYEGVIMRTKEESVATKMLDAMAQEEIWLKSLRPSWKPNEEQEEPEYYQHFDPDC